MMAYEMYCKIVQLHQSRLRVSQIAGILGLDERTVAYWIEEGAYRPRKTPKRASKLDAHKPQILRWLEQYPYTGAQLLLRLREEGFQGGKSVVNEYLAKMRPRKMKAFLTLHFAPGECAQVDWGQYGTVPVGSTRRNLSFFVMVLCYSRMMYVEFSDFSAVNPAARQWLAEVANVRVHGATRQKPTELFGAEKPALLPLPAHPYDTGTPRPVRASNRGALGSRLDMRHLDMTAITFSSPSLGPGCSFVACRDPVAPSLQHCATRGVVVMF